MDGTHWLILVVMLAIGYVMGRVWAQPAQMLGLP